MSASNAIQRILARRPAHVREACTPLEILRRVYGIEPDEWRCPNCGTVATLLHYPNNTCRGCKRPYPRRCTGLPRQDKKAARGCGDLVDPEEWTVRGAKGWSEPEPACKACAEQAGRADRVAAYWRAVPSDEDDLAARAVKSYQTRPARGGFDQRMSQWLEEMADDQGPRLIHVHGPPGGGKSVGAARFVFRAFVDRSLVSSIAWARERELVEATAQRYSRVPDKAAEAERVLSRAKSADLLVVDEAWRAVLSESAAAWFTELWHHRLGDAKKRSLVLANRGHRFDTLGEHIVSRWTRLGEALPVGA